MTLNEYVRILVRRGWIILLAGLLTAGAAYAFSRMQTPLYRATQKLLIAPARNDFGLAQTLKQLMSSWGERLSADARAAEVIEALDTRTTGDDTSLDMTPGALASRVTVSPDLNTLILAIDVELEDGIVASRVANTYGKLFVAWRNQQNAPLRLEDRIDAELLDYPNYSLFRPNTTVNVAAGGLLGMIVGGAIAFVLEVLGANIIRRREDVERGVELRILATLPDGG
ncbi:MAG TPA: Wzz/FepE/Etk N-terminal domain-containing protein [Aggregatilineales bacterium]|nr:hypothetical protein [Anaerolineales bacterium]HRE49178.1 Wzz/FepE/Etk N-terminal domain-containing protein [Aggregatilineales bacterium]